jgi:hypothetical protein
MATSGLIAIAMCCLAVDAPISENVREIIKNVREHEAARSDLDVTVDRTYTRMNGPDIAVFGKSDLFPTETRRSTTHTHHVSQDVRFRVESTRFLIQGDGDSRTIGFMKTFDGTTTRALDQAVFWTEKDGRDESRALFRPHMLLRPVNDRLSLGDLLEHGENFGGSSWDPSRHTIEYEASELREGIPCVRVLVTNQQPRVKEWANRLRLWLATERQYLPVQIDSYSRHTSEDIPTSESVVTRWIELDGGRWLPAEGRTVRYDSDLLNKEQRKMDRWIETFAVSDVSAKPQHPDDFFQLAKP